LARWKSRGFGLAGTVMGWFPPVPETRGGSRSSGHSKKGHGGGRPARVVQSMDSRITGGINRCTEHVRRSSRTKGEDGIFEGMAEEPGIPLQPRAKKNAVEEVGHSLLKAIDPKFSDWDQMGAWGRARGCQLHRVFRTGHVCGAIRASRRRSSTRLRIRRGWASCGADRPRWNGGRPSLSPSGLGGRC